ncbi:phosphatidylinositol glycan anchor biosynthesis class U protein [Anopheles aquasalis]|uniref:phosphatidylinositol glycan anchor biosynthesis class U protein n=1 Tax=Anopheles aquasalis TaxID=42839 RepID=UPI00215A9AEE|nr:phosphatidylinositol glycan anchor biosynthesis class U protein [Anopheles aquasalis]
MKQAISIGIAAAVRFLLMHSRYAQSIQNRVEVSTPINAWKRVEEGAYLYGNGINPYDGDVYHKNPLILVSTRWLIATVPNAIPALFILLDVLSGILLILAARVFIREMYEKQRREMKSYAKDTEELHLVAADLASVPMSVGFAYLFNPYAILNCVGQTTTVWSNFLLALFLYALSRRQRGLALVALALETQINLYPFVLLAPGALYIANQKTPPGKSRFRSIALSCTLFLVVFLAINYWSSWLMRGDWSFLDATYGFIINCRSLQPNIGLFWYFFTEMFDHFRTLFLYSFQINATLLYLFPLTFKLHKEPIMLATMLIGLTAVFRSYPCVGDVSFYLALIPLWKSISMFMKNNFIVGATILVTSVLAPTVWHLWIYNNSANANFYFGVTLIFCTAQIFLITDLFFGYIKREFCLKHGIRVLVDGKEARITLEY